MLGKMARSAPHRRSGCPRCRSQPAFHLRLSGKLEKRYCSHQFGSHRGIPRQSSMPIAITFLKNRVGFTATVEGRFAVVVASIHIAAFAIILCSEVDVVVAATFVLPWGFLNFFC